MTLSNTSANTLYEMGYCPIDFALNIHNSKIRESAEYKTM